MPFCTNCGSPLDQTANFCGNCGTPNQPQQPSVDQQYSPPHYTSQQTLPTSEQIQSFIIMSKDKRFGGTDYYTAVLTTYQMIFLPMTKDMLKQVMDINRQEAKGKVAPVQIYPYQQSYFAVSPASLAAQGFMVIQNSAIQQISFRLVNLPGDEMGYLQEYEVKITSDIGLNDFRMSLREENIQKLMQAFPGRVTRG